MQRVDYPLFILPHIDSWFPLCPLVPLVPRCPLCILIPHYPFIPLCSFVSLISLYPLNPFVHSVIKHCSHVWNYIRCNILRATVCDATSSSSFDAIPSDVALEASDCLSPLSTWTFHLSLHLTTRRGPRTYITRSNGRNGRLRSETNRRIQPYDNHSLYLFSHC